MKLPSYLLSFVFLSFIFLMSCDDDNDDVKPSDESDIMSDLTDPADLADGEAEFAASGYSNFYFDQVSARWNDPGSISYGSINYSMTTIFLQDSKDSLRLNITLLVKDPEEEGKLPTVGTYPVGVESTPEQYGSVSLGPLASSKSWDSYNNTTGEVEVTQMENSVITGKLNISKLDTSAFGADEAQSVDINLGATFKAELQ